MNATGKKCIIGEFMGLCYTMWILSSLVHAEAVQMEKEIEGRQRQPTVAPRRRGRRKDCGRMKMSWIWDISIGINLQGAGSELGGRFCRMGNLERSKDRTETDGCGSWCIYCNCTVRIYVRKVTSNSLIC